MAEHKASELTTRLAAQNQWLGNGPVADGWKAHLKTDDLQAQIAPGDAADPAIIATILERYQSDTTGLNKPQFVAVREALVAWKKELAPLDLAKAATDAKATFVSPAADCAAKSKAKLVAALAKLNVFLARAGAQHQQGWQKYLEWSSLEAELAKADGPNLSVLEAIAAKYFQNENGLEMKPFLAVRDALQTYIADAALVADKDPAATYGGGHR